MVKKQIDVIVALVDGDAFLPCHEGEVAAQFDDETLQLGQDGGFEVFFRVAVRQTEKVEHIRIAEGQVWR